MKILSTRRIVLIALLIALSGGGYYAYATNLFAAAPAAKSGKPTTPVLVARATTKTIPVIIRTIGTAQARATVSIRSRVNGQIMETAFTEGQMIRKGDPLFRIDPRPFQAKLREAEANLARDQASLDKAKSDFERYQSLSGKGFSSQQKYEESRAAMNAFTATIRADQAAVDLARLDLEFATIRAPITGRTGSVLVNAGNLVEANASQPLVVINETDPILASFSVPERHLAEIQQRIAEGRLDVEATIPDSKLAPISGQVVFINNAVDTQTGTIQLKASFDNPSGHLTPGQFVRIVIEMDALTDAVVVPERTLQVGQKGSYLFIVKSDMTVEPIAVTPGPTVDGFTVVDALAAGDLVVTDGQLRLFKGAKVSFKSDGPKEPKKAAVKSEENKDGALTASADDAGKKVQKKATE
jgi:membrane fusion protein, multidrug efflux system